MNKINSLALLFVLATAFTLNGQTTQGSFSLGLHNYSPLVGDIGGVLAPTNALGISFTTSKSKEDGVEDPQSTKSTTIGLNANASYFVIDNLSAGINLSFLTQTQKEEGGVENNDYKTTIFMAGPELRYFIPASAKTKVWVGAGGSFGSAKSEFNGNNDNDPTKLSRLGGGAGLAFFPNSNFSIDLGLGYSVFTSKYEYTNFLNEVTKYEDTTGGITFDVGFSVYF
jgi:opacity protein-like surface antigen